MGDYAFVAISCVVYFESVWGLGAVEFGQKV